MQILKENDDGTLVGWDGEQLRAGRKVRIPHSALTITVEISDDGNHVIRNLWAGTTLHGQAHLTRDAVIADLTNHFLHDPNPKHDAEWSTAMAEQLWLRNLATDPPHDEWADALAPDGTIVQVRRLIDTYEWEPA